MPATTKPAIERFWKFVSPEPMSGCWLWTGAVDTNGYGIIGAGGREGGTLRAHRLSFEHARGPVPDGLFLLHKCDVRSCVNPDHMFVGTARDNSQDMARKGRHGLAKMTPELVRRLRADRRNGVTYRELCKRYGITMRTVAQIVLRITWTHVSDSGFHP